MSARISRRDTKKLAVEVKRLRADLDGLLDILNAILEANGGVVAVSTAQLHVAKRREIEVIHGPKGVLIKRAGVPTVSELTDQQPSVLSKLWLPGKGSN